MNVLPLRERNKQRVAQRIIAAAMELFKTRGCQQTTMDDIADKAEISRGTLFNYFPSKDALLLPWGQEILQEYIQPKLTAYLATQPSTIQVLQFLFVGMSENFPASPDVIRAFMDEALKPKNKPHMDLARTGTLGIIAQVLRYGQARGEVRTDIPLETMANYVGALQAGLLFRPLESTPPEDSSQEIARLLLFIEAGLAVPSEPK